MQNTNNMTNLHPAAGYLLAEVVNASVSDGGIILPDAAVLENKKKVVVIEDPSGTYAPGTMIYPQEATGAPKDDRREYVWVKLDSIYGYRK